VCKLRIFNGRLLQTVWTDASWSTIFVFMPWLYKGDSPCGTTRSEQSAECSLAPPASESTDTRISVKYAEQWPYGLTPWAPNKRDELDHQCILSIAQFYHLPLFYKLFCHLNMWYVLCGTDCRLHAVCLFSCLSVPNSRTRSFRKPRIDGKVRLGASCGWSLLISSVAGADNAFIHLAVADPTLVTIRLSTIRRHNWPSMSAHNTIDGRITTGNELPASSRPLRHTHSRSARNINHYLVLFYHGQFRVFIGTKQQIWHVYKWNTYFWQAIVSPIHKSFILYFSVKPHDSSCSRFEDFHLMLFCYHWQIYLGNIIS